MPTEVTPGYHGMGWAQSPSYHPMSHSLPAAFPASPHLMTGPARALDCLPPPVPMPNGVLAKGIRNPYMPYAGETYRPAATSAYGGLGGYRLDDGWDGSVGRNHVGHAPDMMSTAGANLRQPVPGAGAGTAHMHAPALSIDTGMSASGWRNAPSSYRNHARMTPSLVSFSHSHSPSLDVPPPQGPPIHHRSSSLRRPHGSPSEHSRTIPIEPGCHQCEVRSQHGHGSGRRMSDGALPGLGGSPLRYAGAEELRRHESSSSRRSGRGSFSSER